MEHNVLKPCPIKHDNVEESPMVRNLTEQLPLEVLKHLKELGQRVRIARVRRRTLYRIKHGEPGIGSSFIGFVAFSPGIQRATCYCF